MMQTTQRTVLIAILCVGLLGCPSSDRKSDAPRTDKAPTTVAISKPTEQEIQDLSTLGRLGPGACSDATVPPTCKLKPSQAIKWGWGLCEDDEAALRSAVAAANVELYVDGYRVPAETIAERDEKYERDSAGSCHTWFVKLSDWHSGARVELENRSAAHDASNVFEITVE